MQESAPAREATISGQLKPISGVKISEVAEQYIQKITHYLEEDLGCQTRQGQTGELYIRFPEGTREEVCLGQSTPWTYKTRIIFQDGKTLTKLTKRFPSGEGSITMMMFPKAILGIE